MNKTILTFFGVLFTLNFTFSQCNLEETIVICDMTMIDHDNDGQPDGIINLYDEYTNQTGNAIQAGTWFDPGFNFALDPATGDLSLWDLSSASENVTDYQFQLTNANCGSDIALTINIVLGPFSGFAVPTINENDVNVEVCDTGIDPCGSSSFFDLNHALLSVPSAHSNGIWSYNGTSPNFLEIQDNTYLLVDIPYQSGTPLVDEETFELTYTVPGIAPCAPDMVTNVKVSVIREVFAGAANKVHICEDDLAAGLYDNIDLRDDAFLVNEDIEGIWLYEDDTTGQLTSYGDSVINLGEVYDDIYQANPRFGCETLEYSYFVESRSAVCNDKTSTVRFTLFEQLRPFSQGTPFECCCLTQVGNLNLYDLLQFTTENGVLYDYPNDACTNWTLVSGPSDLGLVSNTGSLCSVVEDPNYTALGSLNLDNISNDLAGTYVFEFTVLPEYNCGGQFITPEVIYDTPDACNSNTGQLSPCQPETAQVTITILPKRYAGQDTVSEFCEPNMTSPVNLFDLMNTNGSPIYQGPEGAWYNLDTSEEISNMFDIPDVTGQETFNFMYSTEGTPEICPDSATLTFAIFEPDVNAGTGSSQDICLDEAPFELFDLLTDNPDTTGTWTGPNGFTSTSNSVMFDPTTFAAGDYIYTVAPTAGPCPPEQSTVSITLVQNLSAGTNVSATICRSDLVLNLNNVLSGADPGGTFVDIENTGALSDDIVNLWQLTAGTYNFEYQVQAAACSNMSTSNIQLTIIEGAAPTVNNQTFCLTDLATIDDLEVNTTFAYYWYDTEDSTTPLLFTDLLEDGEDYYLAVDDGTGCLTSRSMMQVDLLPITDEDCACEINDGISDNGDGDNDELDLCNLTEVFPNFELTIFNRYGTIVFKGNHNTPSFHGESNVSPTLGKRLPTGIYFYVFNPNDDSTEPFQGNFYLSH